MRSVKVLALALVLYAHAWAANPTVVCAQTNNGSAATSAACTGTITSGATEVIQAAGVFNSGGGVTNLSLSDSQGNTIWAYGPYFTTSGGCINPASNGICVVVWIIPNVTHAGSDTFTASWTTSASFTQVNVSEVTGSYTFDPYDGLGSATSSGATSISVAANGHSSNVADIAIGFCAQNTNQATAGSGFTGLDTTQVWITMYKTAVAGNVTGSCTYSSSNGVIALITLRPSGSTYSNITLRQALSAGVINGAACTIMIVPEPGNTFGFSGWQINGNGATYTTTKPSDGGTWTLLTTPVNPNDCFTAPANARCDAAYIPTIAVNTPSISWHVTPTDNASCSYASYFNVASTNPVDTSGTATFSITSPFTSSAVTTTNANDLLIGYGVTNTLTGTGAITPTGAWNQTTTGVGVGGWTSLSDQIVSSIQTGITYTATWNGTGSMEGALYSFKQASGGSPGAPHKGRIF